MSEANRLLALLVADPVFRARFAVDPAGTARELGLTAIAEDLARGGSARLQSLDRRESRSSLAGAFMAAAAEAIGLVEAGGHLFGADVAQAATGPPSGGHVWNADQFGAHGTGGPETPEVVALLDNHNVTFDAAGIADLTSGRIDPRVVTLLEELSAKHQLTISSMCSDHPEHTAGGSISNHFYGRAFDIATVDGKPVDASNEAARQLAIDLASADPSVRPTEIGSPWALPGAAYFSDADHQNHIHVGYDDPIAPDWKPPADSAAAEAAPGAAAPAASIPDPGDDSSGDDSSSDDSSSDESDDGDGADGESGGDDDSDSDSDSDSDEDEDEPGEGSNGEDAQPDAPDTSDSTGSDASSSDSSDTPSGGGDAVDAAAADVTAYPGDGASRDQIAAWMATAAKAHGLPPELPVMAALVESGLANLDHGDADSVGFFQMRTSIWDNGAYQGYPHDAKLQLQWFLDHAEAVKQQRIAAGLPLDSQHYGDWIADVERPAEQYRGRYQLRLDEARELLAAPAAPKASPANDAQVMKAVEP